MEKNFDELVVELEKVLDNEIEKLDPSNKEETKDRYMFNVKKLFNKDGDINGYQLSMDFYIPKNEDIRLSFEELLGLQTNKLFNPARKRYNIFCDNNSDYPSIVFLMNENNN